MKHHLLQKEEGKDVAKYFGLVPSFVASSHACGGTFISSNAASYVVRKEDDHSSPLAANVTEAQRVKIL